MTPLERANLDEELKADQAKFPGMEKRTFVENRLGDNDLHDLCQWLIANPDLHGQVFESQWTGCNQEGMQSVERDGKTWWKMDQTKPHYRVRIAVEVVKDGKPNLRFTGDQWDGSMWDGDCDD